MQRGIGEPKWNTDGSAYMQGWGRPQDDGPALRAASLCRLANMLLDDGRPDLVTLVRTKLYDSVLPTQSLIKTDLEYVSHNWSYPCVDLWEELSGYHFYTRMVQRGSFGWGKPGHRSATAGPPPGTASRRPHSRAAILAHWDTGRGFLRVTLDQVGKDYKSSGLDIAVILGVLHANTPGRYVPRAR